MQEVLKQGKKDFEKEVKNLNEKMTMEVKKLTDHESRLEYLKIMKQPNQKGSAASRFSLLLQNQALIKMQITSEDKMTTEQQIHYHLEAQLVKAHTATDGFVAQCKQLQDILIDIEDGVEKELQQLEHNFIAELQGNYSKIQGSFMQFQKQIANQQVEVVEIAKADEPDFVMMDAPDIKITQEKQSPEESEEEEP